jgi:hypothetical protein
VKLSWEDLKGRVWRLRDVFTVAVYERDRDEMYSQGLYVELPAWGFHLLDRLQALVLELNQSVLVLVANRQKLILGQAHGERNGYDYGIHPAG